MSGQAGAIALLSAITAFHLISAQPGYILTLPRTLRAGGEETFCVTLHDVDDPVFAFTLRLTHKETQEEHDFEYEITESYSQCLKFKVPTATGEYDVVLRNDNSTIEATGITEVEVKTENLITLVQTDKPIYKPGQRVQFRVLTLTRDLKTRTGEIQSIFIKTPNDIRVKQWLNVQCQGVCSFKYPMPAEPTLGGWTIEVTIDGETTSQPFKVQEYVLPRFDIEITPPPYLLSNASTIDGKVCAQYTYGKPVAGYVRLEVCLTSSSERPCYIETVKFDGCYKFSVNTSEVEMANSKYYLYGATLRINASVREINTAVVANKTSIGPTVTNDPLKITLEDDSNGFFKPVFPYRGRAVVTTPDGKPAPDELIEVTLVDYRNDIRLANNYTTDSDGIIHFSVCDIITEKTQDFSIDAKAVLYANPSSYYGLSNALSMTRAYKTVKQWYSPSQSYIAIPRQRRTVACGRELDVTIPYTTTLNTYTKFYYQVMSRGRILHTGHHVHHFLKHDSTEFLEVPMASCLQKLSDPTPPPETGQEVGGEEGAQNEGEAIESVEHQAEIHGGVSHPLRVRKKRAPVIGELEQMRDGEEEEGEQMKHDNKTHEGNDTFEDGDSNRNTLNDTTSQHERDDTHVEGGDGATAHEEPDGGGGVVPDEGGGGDVHDEGGGGTTHDKGGGGDVHEEGGGGTLHEEGDGDAVHGEGGVDTVHEEGGGTVHEEGGGGTVYEDVGTVGNFSFEVLTPVHEGNDSRGVHSVRQDGNGTLVEADVTMADTNATSEQESNGRDMEYVFREGNRAQEEGNYTHEAGNHTHEDGGHMHREGEHLYNDNGTRSGHLTDDGKVTNNTGNDALHDVVGQQAKVSQGVGGEIQNGQSERTVNDTEENGTDYKETVKTNSGSTDHAPSDDGSARVNASMVTGVDVAENGTSNERRENCKENCRNTEADDLGNDYSYNEYDEYDDEYDDDDYDDEYDEDTRNRNQITEDIYGEEPIQAAIFRPFGLRKKRASGIAAEMAGNDDGVEGGEEAPPAPTGPPPPPPSRHVSHFNIRVPVTEEMSPEASLLVYYVRDDGEIVADSINFKVEACFKNKVNLDFLEKKVIPGTEATLRLQAAPGSLCSVGMIDKSINILGGDHQLTPDKMFDILRKYGGGGEHHHYYRLDREYCERKVNDEERAPEHEMYMGWWHYASRYVDAIEAFRQMGMAVSTNMLLETRPCDKEYPVYYDGEGMGLPSPMTLQTDLPRGIPLTGAQKKKPSGSVLRSYFPETWLWELEQVGEEGELELRKTTPHTITRWVGNTICTSQSAGVGVSPLTSLTTYQPFFLSMHLPYAAVRGERLPLHVTVFNYLEKCLHMQVNLEAGDDITLTVRDHLKLPFCLCGGKSKTHSYYIAAKEVGQLPIVAKAEIVPGTCDNSIEPDMEYIGLSDAVKRELFVKVEGVTQEYTKSVYICPKDSEVTREVVELPLPDDIVRDSARGHISVIGDIMGPALSNLDNLVQLPTGCGEQTMITFTPNIYVLKYLTFTSQLTEEMKLLCERYMETGYSRELNYMHSDGSFSAFGKSDPSGSTWLTAFVVKSFAQAQRFIYIDQTNLDSSVSFLKSNQMENGCFREVGKVFSSYMMGGLGKVEDDTALTAFVVVALMEARVAPDDPVLSTALRCLSLQPLDEMDTYTLTLTAYAQTLNDPSSPASEAVMTELEARVISDGVLAYWGRAGSVPDAVNTWHYRTAPSAEIEMTSYGLMATLLYYEDEAIARGQPTILWLSQQRNSFGGFASTQDTVLGLQAMAEFASKTFTGNATDLSVAFDGDKMSKTYDIITGVNTLLLQRTPITHLPNTLTVSTNGTGCALIQANVQFNKLPETLGIDKPLFNLDVTVRRSRTKRSDCARRSIRISVSFMGKKDFSAGMSMLTVRMVTAWTPVLSSLQELESVFPILSMKKYENDVKKGLIAFYFDELDVRKRSFEFELVQDRDLAVSDPKPAEIQVFQYYEKDVTLVKSYEIDTTCGTKEEIPDQEMIPTEMAGSPNLVQNRIQNLMNMPPLPTQKMLEPTGCPVCLNEKPEDFGQLICQSKAIYKVQAGRNGKASMKIKADLRPRRKTKMDVFASYALGSRCQCDLLNPPMRRLLILSKRERSLAQILKPGNFGHVIQLDSNSIIINLDRNRKVEKETRKKARSCSRKS